MCYVSSHVILHSMRHDIRITFIQLTRIRIPNKKIKIAKLTLFTQSQNIQIKNSSIH